SYTLAASRAARVFEPRRVFEVAIGCLYGVGAWVDLPAEYPDGPFFASGRHVAFVGRGLCDPEDCLTMMHVFDLAARRWVTAVSDSGVVGRVVVSRRGAVAWIACPNARSARCPKQRRAHAQVWRMDGRGEREVASGRDVDPYSLRLAGGGRIQWREGGRVRSDTLAGTPRPDLACYLEYGVPRGC
ncbi:MAG: hypothetical protein M3340_18860, partial [Actinomycetota bacterium]|nr:hypothetical protein [Actinomycetota bacterium]